MRAYQASNEVFNALVDYILTIEQLYRLFAEKQPANSTFWRAQAVSEHHNAAWLRALQVEVQERAIHFNAARFTCTDIVKARMQVEGWVAAANVGGIPRESAREIAHRIEAMPVRRCFYEVIARQTGIAQQIHTALADSTQRQHERLLSWEMQAV